MDETPWTPYALEPLRRKMRRRRLGLGITAMLVLVLAWLVFSSFNQTEPGRELEVIVDGQKGTIEVNGTDLPENKPITVKVSPGRIIEADPQTVEPASRVQRSPTPQYQPKVYLWSKVIQDFGPLLLIGSVFWLVGKRDRRARQQVNFGIYKGSLPLEMHTASHRHLVVTGRTAERSIFGKDREDYVPREAYVPGQQVPAGVVFESEDREAG